MLRSRLIDIVEFSYARLRNKINGGRIQVYNESSLQLHLSAILKATGEMFEYKRSEMFSIELEKPHYISNGNFAKSGTKKARIDIFISIEDTVTREREGCGIELKFFKRENQREPNNRYDIYADLQNLERYGDVCGVGFLIVGTDHDHYVNKMAYSADTADFDTRHGFAYLAGTELTYRTGGYGPPITLANSYQFTWDKDVGGVNFLKLQVTPSPTLVTPINNSSPAVLPSV